MRPRGFRLLSWGPDQGSTEALTPWQYGTQGFKVPSRYAERRAPLGRPKNKVQVST